ncbi:hypothetical protein C834K_0603 [Chlamydia poikilotherma]|uniref:Uncharacterized protein n=1 Tax=Chlamydia poikilotherma TaxID=1967783 RepID=A0A3B0Q842_9CHLA|nr:hypothetical protein [Chlamydia poikilotherma]SYX09057.1 hypothetical protein C834K_0603 [Chlamydia poikilotherma]
MFIDRYPNNWNFSLRTKNHGSLIRSSFVRNQFGVQPIHREWNISTKNGVFSKANILEIKKAAPILGTIMGLGRLYSVWSTKDHTTSKIQLLLHTLTGVVETLGLGIILLIAKIMRIAIKMLCEKVGSYCCCNRYENLETSSTSSEDSTGIEDFRSNLDLNEASLANINPQQFANLFSTTVHGDPSKGERVTVSLTVDPQAMEQMINTTTQLLSNIINLDEEDEESIMMGIAQFQNIVGTGPIQNQVHAMTASLKELSPVEEKNS